MIRGAVYRVDLGDAKRGHERRGKRFGLVLSPSGMAWSVVTIVPASTSAQGSPFRPELEIAGTATRLLVDQIRTVDVSFVHGDPVHYPDRYELAQVEHAVTLYLGL
ncbi:type II toxin-antitoxin system PemK/MazF family toxin [Streptomyces sp. TN58]|uniref:type II toxin-antitoxin system PemK/MazF family toxin n=1 Tax=Streptomyces sp. TN58 TaxID=234612 RepID=UPI0009503FD6|nr:type II toxin-antitoxin system PemK/MazF family toxin [Streptomyces sp. TN58]APU41751.1 growth inhibitor PemK [Streptomyces sp. TN58]